MQYYKNFYQIKSNEEIFESIKCEIDEIGYYNLPLQILQRIKNLQNSKAKRYSCYWYWG